jgi:GNAT superfamily N-acetyltransferase
MSVTLPILAAMAEVSGWRIEQVPISHPDAALLVEEVQQEYVVRYGGRDETPIEPGYFEATRGAFFVGYLDDEPVATGAWRRREDVVVDGSSSTAEVKRMYVAPRARGRGLARAMLAHLEDTARGAGAEAMVLETGQRQPEAIALYESSGYTEIAGFGFYKDAPLSRCFARPLASPKKRTNRPRSA